MRVEAGVGRALAVGGGAVAGERDEPYAAAQAFAHRARELVAVHAGQADVDHRHVGRAGHRRIEARRGRRAPRSRGDRRPAGCAAGSRAHRRCPRRSARAPGARDAAREAAAPRAAPRVRAPGSPAASRVKRAPRPERCSAAMFSALTLPPCSSTSRFTSERPMPRPPPSGTVTSLAKRSKTCGSSSGRMPGPRVLHAEQRLARFLAQPHADLAAGRGELGGIADEVGEHLIDARRIGAHQHRGELELPLVCAARIARAHRGDRSRGRPARDRRDCA